MRVHSQGKPKPEKGGAMSEAELKERLAQYAFYHIIQLTETLATPGNPVHVQSQMPVLESIERLDLRGKRVLDIGCRDGLYSFAAERAGADEVIGIDNDVSRAAVEFLIPYFDSSVRMHEMNVLNLTPQDFGMFDVVIFAGVLYHLRHPFWALKRIRDVTRAGGGLILESAIFYGSEQHPMLYCPTAPDGAYGPTSCTFFNERGLRDTLGSLGWQVTTSSFLHPDARGNVSGSDPIIDRAVFSCELSGAGSNPVLERYWHGTHRVHNTPDGKKGLRTGEADWINED